MNLYDSEDEIQDKEFVVKWTASRGTMGEVPSMIMSETKSSNVYGDKWDSITMDNYITNTGIYFSGTDKFLNDDGAISIYNDETNELIATFTKKELAGYTSANPYKYKTPVKHIRAETTTANPSTDLHVYNIKKLDVNKVLEDFTKEDVRAVELVYTYLTGICNIEGQDSGKVDKMDYAYFVSEKSNSEISVSNSRLSTQETLNNQKIFIKTPASQIGEAKWKNGEFIVELPEEIINMEINSVSVSDSNVKVIAHDAYEQNGKYFIKVITENEELTDYTITVDCNMTPDPRISTANNKIVKLYSYNQNCNDYYYEVVDTYDVDGDNNKEEKVGTASTTLNFISPTSLITLETISNYNDKGEITVAPNVANVARETRQATVNVTLSNNYPDSISNVMIVGKIPFEGNTYILNKTELNSRFTTTMTEEGIILPDEFKDADVYYSENENPTKDLENEANGWKLKEDIQEISTIKSYLIDLEQYTIEVGRSYKFNYNVHIPEGITYGLTSYCDHAVYYSLDTEGGKLEISTEPNKVGVRITKKYDFELVKYKESTTRKVGGATYTLEEKDSEGNVKKRILTTDSNGSISMKDLYIGAEYTVTEVKAPDNYLLNNEVFTFKVVEENGEIKLVTNSNKVTFSEEKVTIITEDEPKYNLKLTKTDAENGAILSKVAFLFQGKKYTTDNNGQITLPKLVINQEYTLQEIKSVGYYLLDDITFKIIKDENGNLIIESNNEQLNNAKITNSGEEDLVQVEATLSNEKIPTYNLQVLKVEENFEEEDIEKLIPLKEATFSLTYIDLDKEETYTTDERGIIDVPDLYQYVDGRNVTGRYILQEIEAPDGYANCAEEIIFKAMANSDGGLELILEDKESLTTVKQVITEGNTIKIVIQDKPLFKLTKTDSETGKLLANAQFIIFEVNNDGKELGYAKDANGEPVGVKNDNDQYIITTDETGTISVPLRAGKYKIVEVGFPDGYLEYDNEQFFEVVGGKIVEDPEEEDDETNEVMEINSIEDLVDFSKSVNRGNHYEKTTVKLMRTLDFEDEDSYENKGDKSYGDLNGNGTVEEIMIELTSKDGCGFTPIGNTGDFYFSGAFDGQNNEIRNIYMNFKSTYNSNIGLFGKTEDAEIRNIGVTGEIIGGQGNEIRCLYINNSNDYTGLFGCVQYGEIKNLGITGEVSISNGTIGTVYCSGGIAGNIWNSSISNCYNTGKVSMSSSDGNGRVGGIAGDATSNSNISDCYNTKEIISSSIWRYKWKL